MPLTSSEVEKRLANHERRLLSLERVLYKGSISKPKKASRQRSGVVSGLPGRILALREGGFFSQPRTADHVHGKLLPTYHCELNRVAVALIRLAGKHQRRKVRIQDKGRTYQAYVW